MGSGSRTATFLRAGASKNARDTSEISITLFPRRPPGSIVAASLISHLRASRGGVGANSPSSCPVLNSLPTSRLRYTGFMSSPLFTSIHLVSTILYPSLSASSLLHFTQNTLILDVPHLLAPRCLDL